MPTYIITNHGPLKTLDVDTFYKNLNNTKFNNINTEIILNLINNSKILNKFYNNENIKMHKSQRYIKIMNAINCDFKRLNLNSQAEKYLLFMFSVDPNFEAFKIFNEYNTTKEIKQALSKYFGIYDAKLISIEKLFIKNFLSEKKKNEINEEIEKRIFK